MRQRPSRQRLRQRGAAFALSRASRQPVAWGSSVIFISPPPSRFAPTPRLDLSGHHCLPAFVDLNMLVDVLNYHVLPAPERTRSRASMPVSPWRCALSVFPSKLLNVTEFQWYTEA